MRKSKVKKISLAVCMALMPLYGFAAGLGKLNVTSGLGEPLRAEVALISVTPEELSTLVATIASEEAYAVQGIIRLGIHSNIKVDLAKNADGSPVLRLHSNQPISDPYLDMLIQVDWASGRLLREYTILLDPPGYKDIINNASVNTTLVPTVSLPSATQKISNGSVSDDFNSSALDGTQKSANQSKKLKKINNQATQRPEAVGVNADVNQLITTRGDTLNSLAKKMQVEGVSLDQMLVGLFEQNKEAFTNGNMNRLKVGQIIKAPPKESLTAIGAQEARQAVKVHSANWNDYRNSLAGAVAAKPTVEEAEQKQSASGKITTAEDQAAPIKAGAQDVVKLSAGEKGSGKVSKESGKDVDAKVSALQLSTLQEEAIAREKAFKESQQRISALEKQIEDMQKLLVLKNQTMTDLQKNAEETVTAVEEKTADNQVKPVAEVKKAPPVVQAPVEVVSESSFYEGLFNDVDMTLIGGAAGVTLLGAGWMFLRNKRRKDLDSFERGILTSGGLRANTVFGNTTGSSSTSDTSFLTDFAQSADGNMIDTNDVDPIAEAEVYMAYGRDAQAEEILKDAILKEPKRYELHLKLLEMYAGRKDTAAFETIAGELYTTLGADDPTWAKVAELGVTVEPENPLYDISNIVSANALVAEKLDHADLAEVTDIEVSAENGLDFSLDTEDQIASDELVNKSVADDANSAVMQSFVAAENVDQDQSFDLGSVDVTASGDIADGAEADTDLVSAGEQGRDSISGISSTAVTTPADIVDSLEDTGKHGADLDSSADNLMDFDISDFNVKENSPVEPVAVTADEGASVFEFENTVDADPVVDLNLPAETNKLNQETSSDAVELGLEFDFPEEATSVAAADLTPEVELEPELPEPEVEEISFDLPLVDDEELTDGPESIILDNEIDANAFDFSAISLDLGEDDIKAEIAPTADELSVELAAPTASENQDVDIKLDLVAAYIDMDDKEGARELLDEVIKEGGPQQVQRAEQLLAGLA
ncbi:MAG: FimV/HubP family polar landmark protein [Methylotenera sp.]|nr:FimV/HubP family polar landmark protein [Methylotenera sp.]